MGSGAATSGDFAVLNSNFENLFGKIACIHSKDFLNLQGNLTWVVELINF